MTEDTKFKFKQKVSDLGFSQALSERVDAYFHDRGISKHANAEMFAKTVFGFAAGIGSYAWLMTGRHSYFGIIGIYVLIGFAQLYMAFNIAHDANHGAYSASKRVNRLVARVFDLVGVSSYIWRLMHNDSHHSFINIEGADTTLVSGNIFRFSPRGERKSYHRFQHLYATLLYCLSTLDWVLLKDYRWLMFGRKYGNRRITKHPLNEVVFLFGAKAFYYTYILVLPLLFLTPWHAVILGFIIHHFFGGFIIALIFQPNHFIEGSSYPAADPAGGIANNYINHIFDTTADFAREQAYARWVLGGLNLHVIHHMFPGICHVHYPALTRILMSTAKEHGLAYREYRTVTGAFMDHLRWLKLLGTSDPEAVPTGHPPALAPQ